MYTIVKCTWCTEIIVISEDQLFFICPVCGCSCRSETSTPYLHCEEHTVALAIASTLGEFLKNHTTKELTLEEIELLQKEYLAYSSHQQSDTTGTCECTQQEEKSIEEQKDSNEKEKTKKSTYNLFEEML